MYTQRERKTIRLCLPRRKTILLCRIEVRMRCCAEIRPAQEDKTRGQRWRILHSFSIGVPAVNMLMNIREYPRAVSLDVDAWTDWWTDGNCDSNLTMLHDQSRANERKCLQLFGTWKREPVPKRSRDVSECQASAEIGFGARSCTCPQITCSAEPLLRSCVCVR